MTKSDFEPLLREVLEDRDGDIEDQIKGVLELLVEEGMVEKDDEDEDEFEPDYSERDD